jgi:hypothetical protein
MLKKVHNPKTCKKCRKFNKKIKKFLPSKKLVSKKTRITTKKVKSKKANKKVKATNKKIKPTKKKVRLQGYLSFSTFVNKLKGKKQKVVEYPEKMDPEYIPVKNLFKKK